jgi:hypothetical protein
MVRRYKAYPHSFLGKFKDNYIADLRYATHENQVQFFQTIVFKNIPTESTAKDSLTFLLYNSGKVSIKEFLSYLWFIHIFGTQKSIRNRFIRQLGRDQLG